LTPVPVWDFEIDLTYIYGDLNQTNTAIQQFLDFYQRMHGAADDWLFYDPYDNNNAANASVIGYGDGVTTQFQVGRSLAATAFEPLQNVVPSIVKVAGGTVNPGPQVAGNQWYCGVENLLFYSQDFTQAAYWVGTSVGSVVGGISSIDGSSTADAITFNGTAGFIQQTLAPGTYAPGDRITFACWLKVPSSTLPIVIAIGANPGGNVISTLSATLTTNWQRFQVTGTVPPIGISSVYVYFGQGSVINGSVIHAWGAQVERWGTFSSYAVTTNNAPVYPRGLLTFTVAPALGAPITVGGDYYYRCHFLDDEFNDLEEFLWQLWELKALKFRSLLL